MMNINKINVKIPSTAFSIKYFGEDNVTLLTLE